MKDSFELVLKSFPAITAMLFNILIVIVMLYIIYRSGSMAIFANKIWGLFIGEKQYYNEKLAKIEQAEHDVAKFNFKTNLKFKTIEQIESFYSQLEKFNLDLKIFKGLRDSYNPQTGKIKKSSKSDIFYVTFVSLSIGCFLLPLFIAVFIFRPLSEFDSSQLINLFAYTFLISISTIFSFGELIRKIKANTMRKYIYKVKKQYIKNRKP
ncbi:DUF6216 family protein [Kosakonia cowanii]|uniref:DUF6216 family protein n=1 Tax=Kosakonia cowanii TaxID=208223 RepID=UPI0040638362